MGINSITSRIPVLVFPGGSEIGLEINRSLRYVRDLLLIGVSSVPDHGNFAYDICIDDIPYVTDENCINRLLEVIKETGAKALFPAMDSVLSALLPHRAALEKAGCRLVCAQNQFIEMCASKAKTYAVLQDVVPTPRVYANIDMVTTYPIFLKPIEGYGSRGVLKAENVKTAREHIENWSGDLIISEYLPGQEYTVDCFSDRHGVLHFAKARCRSRIRMGISVATAPATDDVTSDCQVLAEAINKAVSPRGAWFFQVKAATDGTLKLMEVANRIAGSMALYRQIGINFAHLAYLDAMNIDIRTLKNTHEISMDRAFNVQFLTNIKYDIAYIDFDDCVWLHGKLNPLLMRFIIQCNNENIRTVLITRHNGDIHTKLQDLRIAQLLDEVIHIKDPLESKSKHIKSPNSVFIDDSFSERKEVQETLSLPVFAPDAVTALLLNGY